MIALLSAVMVMYALWLFYLAVMCLQRARDAGTMSKTAYRFGLPILVIGYGLDVFVNVFVLSWLMLEIPREYTVTSRLSRHKRGSPGWRQSFSAWVCVNLLDAFDPSGCHCK